MFVIVSVVVITVAVCLGGFCGFALLLNVVLVWLIVLSCFLTLAVRVIGCCVFCLVIVL